MTQIEILNTPSIAVIWWSISLFGQWCVQLKWPQALSDQSTDTITGVKLKPWGEKLKTSHGHFYSLNLW